MKRWEVSRSPRDDDSEAVFSGILVDLVVRPVSFAASIPFVTIVFAFSSIGLSLHAWQAAQVVDFGPFEPTLRSSPWRLVTSALVHVDVFHLVFNTIWLAHLGVPVERNLGAARTACMMALIAVGASTSEYLFLQGGFGLSGLVFGLVGYLWADGKAGGSALNRVHRLVVPIFTAWFFMCLAMSMAGVAHIANVSHASGAALGVLFGFSRHSFAAGIVLALIGLAFSSRAALNISGKRADEYSHQAYLDLLEDRADRALSRSRIATRIDPESAYAWYLVGYCLHVSSDLVGALAAYERSVLLDRSFAYEVDVEALRGYINQHIESPNE